MQTETTLKISLSLRCPPKVRVFLWKLLLDGLPLRQRMNRRMPNVVDHKSEFLPLEAPDDSEPFWRWWLRLLEDLRSGPHWRRKASSFTVTMWSLWKERNRCVFKQLMNSPEAVFDSALSLIAEYHQFHPP
ncbi:hypothetical protein PIB30_026083 [Stylosanthes scabra]|uniref:Reverse transcriptase zinc-binding domain-containing protein n=1 Tax=Stylosanthes scabra TaxID=79078 RepID=A0ABU6YCG3_9FABA|nr:hypothetical protein [Stylosanthes scabra]